MTAARTMSPARPPIQCRTRFMGFDHTPGSLSYPGLSPLSSYRPAAEQAAQWIPVTSTGMTPRSSAPAGLQEGRPSRDQNTTTLRMLSPACIRSKPLLMSVSGMVWVIMGSIWILPSMYQSTILGTSVRPLAPPNAVPFQVRPLRRARDAEAAGDAAGVRPPADLVGALLGQVDDVGHEVAAGSLGVDEV